MTLNLEVLDPQALQALLDIAEGDTGFIEDLLRTYIEQADALTTDLRLSIASSDLGTMRRSAHTLKGASMNVGALAVAELCRRLEDQAAGGRPIAEHDVTVLQSELARIREAVN